MLDDEIIAQQREQLEIYRRNLSHLVQQAAQHGGESNAPLNVTNDIHTARAHIQRIKATLQARGITVADLPDDAPPLLDQQKGSISAQTLHTMLTLKTLSVVAISLVAIAAVGYILLLSWQNAFGPVTLVIDSTKSWQSTDVVLSKGAIVTVRVVTGRWTGWQGRAPENNGRGQDISCLDIAQLSEDPCPVPSFFVTGLVGRVDEAQAFGIGDNATFVAANTGTLYLRINDGDRHLEDNAGALKVEVSVRQ